MIRPIWQAFELEEALGCEVKIQKAGSIQFNSKDVCEGDIFIAFDSGHDYVLDALERGAALAIVERNITPNFKILKVNNTRQALEKLALYKRERSKAKIIAITGTAGKTSTKECLKLMLQAYASRANFNNYLGLLINLASMPFDAKVAVFELGMNKPGEISIMNEILKPEIALITNIGEGHIEFFNSIDDIAKAKCEIFDHIQKTGTAVIPADSNYINMIENKLKTMNINKVISFGENESTSDIALIDYQSQCNVTSLKYIVVDNIYNLKLSEIPKHFAMNIAASLSVVQALNLSIDDALANIKNFKIGLGRGQQLKLKYKAKDLTIIADYYNSNPVSAKASIKYLSQIKHPNKILILGDMLELGFNSERLHLELAPFITRAATTKVITVGKYSAALQDIIKTEHFNNVRDLIEQLDNFIQTDCLLLIKGSRSIYLEKIIKYLELNS